MAIATNKITLSPAYSTGSNINESREREPYTSRGKRVYTRDCRFRKEDPSVFIKWCRRNFGERSVGWDFSYASELATIEIWDPKFMTMYEMWKA